MLIERIVGTENSSKFLAEYNKATVFILWYMCKNSKFIILKTNFNNFNY